MRVIALICFALLLVGCGERTFPVIVTDLTWQREIPVERWMEVREEGWSVPHGGVIIYTEERVNGTERFLCGLDGDGTSKYCIRPDYDTWYVYRIWKWAHVRSFLLRGGKQDEIRWPDASDYNDQDQVNPERLAPRIERNIVRVYGEKRYWEIPVTMDLWHRLEVRQELRLKVNIVGQPIELIGAG